MHQSSRISRARVSRITGVVNPHAEPPVTPLAMLEVFLSQWRLIAHMTRRDVMARYKGSVMGLAWSFFHPLFMLAVYTFVFSFIFKSRWPGVSEEEGTVRLAIVLFTGLLVHGVFSEVLNRAPVMIVTHAVYVRKVVFPLEILPVVVLGASLFHAVVSLAVLLGASIVFHGPPPVTVFSVPLVLLPLVVLSLGVSWFLASLGVFLRDVAQTMGVITTVLMFLAPVFYPLEAVPPGYRPLIMANPLTFIIEQLRAALLWGRWPEWGGLLLYSVAACLVAWGGFAWFQKTRKGFADVL